MKLPVKNKEWEEDKSRTLAILNKQLNLAEDMILQIKSYHHKKIDDYRLIYYGYLSIAVSHVKATQLLVDNQFLTQVHFISRNMMEMIITLSYIRGREDSTELAQRFIDYEVIIKDKNFTVMSKHPSIFKDVLKRISPTKLDKLKQTFISKYSIKNGKKLSSWSGKSLYEMISSIPAEALKERLFFFYDLITTKDNQYVHPTITYLKDIVYEIRQKDYNEYAIFSFNIICNLLNMMIVMYFDTFSKGRPAFLKRQEELNEDVKNLIEYRDSVGIK